MCCYLRRRNNTPYILYCDVPVSLHEAEEGGASASVFYSFSPIVGIYLQLKMIIVFLNALL